jgi:hypothetical protein
LTLEEANVFLQSRRKNYFENALGYSSRCFHNAGVCRTRGRRICSWIRAARVDIVKVAHRLSNPFQNTNSMYKLIRVKKVYEHILYNKCIYLIRTLNLILKNWRF